MSNVIKQTLSEWARRERQQLPRKIRRLIHQAEFSLHYGPHSEPGYPGFETACRIIAEHVPCDDVWIDVQCGEVLVGEPEPYVDEDTDELIEPSWEDYVTVDAQTAKRAILGELAAYVY